MHPKLVNTHNILTKYKDNNSDKKEVANVIDDILSNLDDDIETPDLVKKLQKIESLKFSSFGETTTIGSMLKQKNLESITKYVKFQPEDVKKSKSFSKAFFTQILPKLHFDEALIEAQEALLALYKQRTEPPQQVIYSQEDINNSQTAREFLEILKKPPQSKAFIDFKRDVEFQGVNTKGKSEEQITKAIREAVGSKAKADFVLAYGGQIMNQLAILEFQNLIKFANGDKAVPGLWTGTIKWRQDENNDLICDTTLELKTVTDPQNPGEYGLGAYSIDKNGELKELDEKQFTALSRKEGINEAPTLAVVSTSLKLKEIEGKAIPEITAYSAGVYTPTLTHGKTTLTKEAAPKF